MFKIFEIRGKRFKYSNNIRAQKLSNPNPNIQDSRKKIRIQIESEYIRSSLVSVNNNTPNKSERSILWFLLHSLLNHEKWITCIFSVKNDSMTHKTINLSDMCYFQPPILIKITVNPLFQFLMLPDNQTRHGKFTFFRVKLYKKGKNMFPSQAYRPSRPIWIVKTWFKPIFSFNTTILSLSRKNVLLISI